MLNFFFFLFCSKDCIFNLLSIAGKICEKGGLGSLINKGSIILAISKCCIYWLCNKMKTLLGYICVHFSVNHLPISHKKHKNGAFFINWPFCRALCRNFLFMELFLSVFWSWKVHHIFFCIGFVHMLPYFLTLDSIY